MMAGVRNNALAHLQQLSRVKVRARPVQLAPLITSVPLLLLFTRLSLCSSLDVVT